MKARGFFLALAVLPTPANAQSDPRIERLSHQLEQLRQELTKVEEELYAARTKGAAVTADDGAAEQKPAASSSSVQSDRIRSARPGNVIPAPVDRGAQSPSAAAIFQVDASTANKQAAIAVTTSISDPGLKGRDTGTAHYETLTWTAAAPLGEDDRTDIGTLDGFANGFSFKVKYSNYSVRLRNPKESVLFLKQRAHDKCVADLRPGGDSSSCDISAGVSSAFMRTNLSANDYQYYLDQYFPPNASFLWGFEGGVGYKEFKFFDAATLTKHNEHRWPVSAKIFGTLLPNSGHSSFTMSAEYQRSFKAADILTYCPLPSGTLPQKCTTGPFDAPSRKTKVLLAGEARAFIPLPESSIIPGIGISGQITYDAHNDELGLDMPIYVVPDDKGNMIGGVRFGYTTSEKDFIVGVFVGTKFSARP